MSRHRDFRNRQYSYDYDDDYYDDDDYDEYDDDGTYAEQERRRQNNNNSNNNTILQHKLDIKKQQPPQSQSQQQQQQKNVAAFAPKVARTVSSNSTHDAISFGGPPPGFQGSGTTATISAGSSSASKSAPAPPGFGPPPGWTGPSQPSGKKQAPTGRIASPIPPPAGPPAGWSRPSNTPATTTTAGKGVNTSKSATTTKPSQAPPTKKGVAFKTAAAPSSRSTTPPPPPKKMTVEEKKGGKSRLSMVILGHVDAGKSTLMGQVLVQMGKVEQRVVNRYQRQAAELGKASFALAWVMDEDESERERGVTMDVATKTISTPNHDITILDAPGHKDFIPAMIGGAASADVGLLVVASTTGEFESGFDPSRGKGQTREHILLSRGLGVSQLIVVVNKLDASEPPWSKSRFDSIQQQILPFCISCGFAPKRIRFVPVSGLTGENVKEVGSKELMSWYKGPTLLGAIDGFMVAKRDVDKPLRLIVNDSYPEGKGVTVRGRVTQGLLRQNETITALPIGDMATVARIEHGDLGTISLSTTKKTIAIARAGDNVEISLTGIDNARINPGFVLSHPNLKLRVPVKNKFRSKIFVLDKIQVPIIRGSNVSLHMHSVDVPAVVSKLVSVVKKGGEKNQKATTTTTATTVVPRLLNGGANATVEITMKEKMCLEEYSQCRSLGRFVLRRNGETVAVGVVETLLD